MNTKLSFKQIIIAGAKAAAVAALINTILFFIFRAAGFITDSILVENKVLTVTPIIISSIVPSLIGACIFFLFEKFSNNGFKIFSIIAIVLLILSFANPFFGIPNVTIAYGIALDIMHVTVALPLLYFLSKAK